MNRTRFPRPLQALQVVTHWLLQPVAPGDELLPAGQPGLLSIETEPGRGSCYMLTILADRARQVLGYQLTKPDGTTYALPADLSSCECKDFLYRGQYRPGGCKHTVAARQALAAALDPFAGWDEVRYAPTAEAIAEPCKCRSAAEHAAGCAATVLRYEQPDWFEPGGDFDPAA